jgi:ribonuclease D
VRFLHALHIAMDARLVREGRREIAQA